MSRMNGLSFWGPGNTLAAAIHLAYTNPDPLTRGSITPTFTRATEATVEDVDGVLRTIPSGARPVHGMRVVENLFDGDMTTWTTNGATVTEVTGDVTAPSELPSNTRVFRITSSGGTKTVEQSIDVNDAWISAYVRAVSAGSNNEFAFRMDSSKQSTITATGDWQRFAEKDLDSTAGARLYGFIDGSGGTNYDIYVCLPMLEDIEGRIDQSAPSEPVSKDVGVGDELLTTAITASDWAAGNDTVEDDGGYVKITFVDGTATLPVGTILPRIVSTSRYHVLQGFVYVDSGDSVIIGSNNFSPGFSKTVNSATAVPFHATFTYDGSGSMSLGFNGASVSAGEIIWVKVDSIKSASHINAGDSGGFKYFNTYNGTEFDSATNTVTAGTGAAITDSNSKFANFVDGSNGNALTVANPDVTGPIEIWADVVFSDYTTSYGGGRVSIGGILSGAVNINNSSWAVHLTNSGDIRFSYRVGASGYDDDSTVTLSSVVSDGTRVRIKITHDTSTGDTEFYYSFDFNTDSPSWVQLGATVSGTSGALDSAPSTDLMVPGNGSYLTENLDETTRVYDFRVYDGIGGTLVERVNPGDYSSGATFTSAVSGETVTINGNAYIYTPPVNATGPLGYRPWASVENLFTYSSDFRNTADAGESRPWVYNNAAITVDQAVAPDGNLTADVLGDDSSTGAGSVRVQRSQTVTSGNDVTVCVWAKAKQLSWLFLNTNSFDAGAAGNTWFNLATGEIGTTSANHTAHIERYPDGWVRCGITFNTTTDTSGNIGIYAADGDNDQTVDLDGTSDIYIWGAMAADGWSVMPPYVATEASTVTRNADVDEWDVSGISGIDGPVTLFVEARWDGDAIANKFFASLNDGTSSNQMTLRSFTNSVGRLVMNSGGVSQAAISGSTLSGSFNISGAFATDDAELYLDGVSDGTPDTSATSPTGIDTLEVGCFSSANQPGAYIQSVKVFTSRLTDAQVAAEAS